MTETYPFTTASAIGGNSGTINENSYSWYGEVVGTEPIAGHNLRYNAGLRFVETHQYITSPVTIVDPRNATAWRTACWMAACIPIPSPSRPRPRNYGSYPAVAEPGL